MPAIIVHRFRYGERHASEAMNNGLGQSNYFQWLIIKSQVIANTTSYTQTTYREPSENLSLQGNDI